MCLFVCLFVCSAVQRQKRITAKGVYCSYAFFPLDGSIVAPLTVDRHDKQLWCVPVGGAVGGGGRPGRLARGVCLFVCLCVCVLWRHSPSTVMTNSCGVYQLVAQSVVVAGPDGWPVPVPYGRCRQWSSLSFRICEHRG